MRFVSNYTIALLLWACNAIHAYETMHLEIDNNYQPYHTGRRGGRRNLKESTSSKSRSTKYPTASPHPTSSYTQEPTYIYQSSKSGKGKGGGSKSSSKRATPSPTPIFTDFPSAAPSGSFPPTATFEPTTTFPPTATHEPTATFFPTATFAPTTSKSSKRGSKSSKRSSKSASAKSAKTSKSKNTQAPAISIPIDFTLCYVIPGLTNVPSQEQVDELLNGTSQFYTDYFEELYDAEGYDFEDLELMITEIELLPGGDISFCVDYEGSLTFDGRSTEVPTSEEVFEDLSGADLDEYLEEVVRQKDGFEQAESVFLVGAETEPPTAPTTPFPTPSPTDPLPTAPTTVPPTESPATPFPTDSGTPSPTNPLPTTAPPTDTPGTSPPTGSVGTDPPTSIPTISPTKEPTAGTEPPTAAPTIAPTGTPTASTPEGFTTDLDLSKVAEEFQMAFIMAAARWDEVIVGDLEDIPVTQADKDASACDNIPDVIDDVHICATIAPNDGVGNILGSAAPELVRQNDPAAPDFFLPTVGTMTFDSDDVAMLVADGTFEDVILHEMGHVYGIGTLWQLKGLTLDANTPCPYAADTKATAEYQSLSGCTTTVPIEEEGGGGTACGHWDEECFLSELMTGFSTGALELSSITSAGLEDLGYTVDSTKTDPYTAANMDPSCVCDTNLQEEKNINSKGPAMIKLSDLLHEQQLAPKLEKNFPRRNGARNLSKKSSRRLSDEGWDKAFAYGKALLVANSHTPKRINLSSNMKYIGDMFVSVLYIEDGEIFAVEVWGDGVH